MEDSNEKAEIDKEAFIMEVLPYYDEFTQGGLLYGQISLATKTGFIDKLEHFKRLLSDKRLLKLEFPEEDQETLWEFFKQNQALGQYILPFVLTKNEDSQFLYKIRILHL